MKRAERRAIEGYEQVEDTGNWRTWLQLALLCPLSIQWLEACQVPGALLVGQCLCYSMQYHSIHLKWQRKSNGVLSKLFIHLVEIKNLLQHPFLAVFLVLDKSGSYKDTWAICSGWAKVPWLWLVQDQTLHREQCHGKSSSCTGKHRMQTLQNQCCFLLDSAFVFNLVLSSTCLHWYRPSLGKPIRDFQTANTFHQGS